jgi:uncharacterized DUF497 family protein
MHTFEFDAHKSQSNHEKHGIDFIDAQQLWNDPYLLEVPTRVLGEPRYLVIGIINDKYWSGVITYRDSNIRIISVRRSRKEEVDIYENC